MIPPSQSSSNPSPSFTHGNHKILQRWFNELTRSAPGVQKFGGIRASWCPHSYEIRTKRLNGVVEGIEQSESFVASMDSGILLKRKELPISTGSSHFCGAKSEFLLP